MEHAILTWSVRGLLMAIGTGLVLKVLRVRAASALHHAWAATTLAMLVLPVWTTWGPSVVAPVLPDPAARAVGPMIDTSPPGDAAMPVVGAVTMLERFESHPFTPGPSAPNWRTILLTGYLVGVVLMMIRLLRGTLMARSILRCAKRVEGFLSSSRCAAPVTVGWIHPVVLLPESWRTWPAARLEAVLIHEREHARRRDPLVQWLALLNRCIFWFHPLSWWLARKLATLAEDACDIAVLSRGHAAEDYARHLIEMARSVSEAGARIRWAGVVAFSAVGLRRRIRRIMDGEPIRPLSSGRSAVLWGCCGVLLAGCLACNLGRRSTAPSNRTSTEKANHPGVLVAPGPGQTQRLQALFGLSWTPRGTEALLEDAVLGLTPSRAKTRDAELRNDPYDPVRAKELVRYYELHKDWKSLDALTLWFILHNPNVRENWGTRPVWDRVWDSAGYGAARQAWLEQLERTQNGGYAYMNAGEYLSGSDNEAAERAFLEASRRFPNSALHWEVFLARHYAWALAGPAGPLREGYLVLAGHQATAMNDDAYAKKVRAKLLASRDTELLTRVVEQLQLNNASTVFAESLLERILAIDPANKRAQKWRDQLRARGRQ